MSAFEAGYPSPCAHPECGTGIIRTGERARYVQGRPAGSRDVLVHETCPAEAAVPETCPSCHMALPLTKVCDDCG